ncbi:methyl-accepting chemotaxis protein [Thiomicrorhabdus aquaedulcis]|uniref:methyl-accepting chemotaxis protein n=1 Tax=Thiomicrorhabdus aquaedulcis TaxID=2211106 RepID=UPI000FDAD4E7|nr:methyl-accepting chemotaxis protein [Thiomicrorhabdus aquaedulcis]
MRNNQPVINDEYIIPEGQMLVSKTDLQGSIIYANEAFVTSSGFELEELLGEPHNILRHPDVPEQVFADFWGTIESGRPWNQIVKNRRKHGGFYWVEANATPIIENDKITGYISVRVQATREQIKEAEAAYAAIKAGKVKLHNGVPDSLYQRLNPLAHWPPLITIIPATLIAILNEILSFFFDINYEFLNIAVVVLTLLSAMHVIYYLNRIQDAIKAVDELTNGQLNGRINTHGANTAGTMNRRLKTMQIRLGAQQNLIDTEARFSQRMKSGMDDLKTYIMLSDQNGTIVFMNQSLVEFLKPIEAIIQKEVSDFNLNKLTGKNIGCLFRNDANILMACLDLKEPKIFKFNFYSAEVQLSMSPIFDSHGKSLGVAIEWQDIFQELFVQQSIKNLVTNASQGKLHSRVDASSLTGFYHDLCTDINALMSNLQKTLSDISILIGGLPAKNLTLKAQSQHFGQYGWTIKSLGAGIESLRTSFCGFNNQAKEVAHSAEHVSESNVILSNSIKNQADELQKTAVSMNLLTQKVTETTEQAKVSNQLAIQTEAGVQASNRNMQEAISAMSEIAEVSQKITGIVTLIDSIAFQTNLLALNAAVEAARAGEHGRGFAVVAGEVRNLAQKSADAAREINGLIGMTAEKIAQGTQKVEATGASLQAIISQVTDMTVNIRHISHNAHQQAEQIHEVNQSIISLEQSASENSTLVLENASLAEYLGDVAKSMDALVGSFQLGDCETAANSTQEQTESQYLVLVVDDNISNQKVAVMLLNRMGYYTKVASNGREAITQCQRYNPAAILMDIEMPGMSGIDATHAIRKMGYQKPILAYTGHGPDFEKTIYAAGMKDIIHKPLKPEELITKLNKVGCPPNTHSKVAVQCRREKLIAKSDLAKQFDAMVKAHLGWKSKIRSFIDGAEIGVTYENAIDHTACALGKWYYGANGQAFMHLPAMKALGEEHSMMHCLIKNIMDAFSIDDYETLEKGINELDTQSDKVVELLGQLIEQTAA